LSNGFVPELVPGPDPQPACASCAAPSKPTAPTANIAVIDPIEFLMTFCSRVDCLSLSTLPRDGGQRSLRLNIHHGATPRRDFPTSAGIWSASAAASGANAAWEHRLGRFGGSERANIALRGMIRAGWSASIGATASSSRRSWTSQGPEQT
jgi:hypothetical protein